jgi:hypothetical protein
MVSKNPSCFSYRGAAAAVLFLTIATLAFTSTRGKVLASAQQSEAAPEVREATKTPEVTKTPQVPKTPEVTKTPDAAVQAREAEAQAFIVKTLGIWQDRMNLKDWDIKVQLVRASALEPRTLGNIHWDTDVKRATIDVLSSYDYTMAKPEMLKDMEFTIVHELVHLDLASLPRSKASRRTEEHAVNQLTKALLKLANK